MKNLITTLCLTFLFFGCNKDETNEQESALNDFNLFGKWKITGQIALNKATQKETDIFNLKPVCTMDDIYVFKRTSELIREEGDIDCSSSYGWVIDWGDDFSSLTIYYTARGTTYKEDNKIINKSKNSMTLVSEDDEFQYTTGYTKISDLILEPTNAPKELIGRWKLISHTEKYYSSPNTDSRLGQCDKEEIHTFTKDRYEVDYDCAFQRSIKGVYQVSDAGNLTIDYYGYHIEDTKIDSLSNSTMKTIRDTGHSTVWKTYSKI